MSGCSDPQPLDQLSGQQLFERFCVDCHKASGRGSFLEGIPPNVTTRLDRSELTTLITTGLSSHRDMPTFQQLSRAQAGLIADHLKRLQAQRQ